MNAILVKIFATALTMSQVTTRPDAVKTSFDAVQDTAEVVQILRDGCAHMRKAFDIEDINLDELIATAMDDPQAVTGNVKVLQGLDLRDLHTAYRQFCKNETVATSPVDIAEVVAYYNKAMVDLPDHTKLKGAKLPGLSIVLDKSGERFAELFQPDNRRLSVPLTDVPLHVQQAFIAAEDKRFRRHKGIDERGVIRAFIGNIAKPGRPQGGSTLTQQVAKNLLVGDDVTYERKMREMVVAARLEQTLSKDEILELYLNSIFLGRGAWGIEMAAQSYFGKSAKALTAAEGAMLAGLAKGPNFYSPDRYPERTRERISYVLNRMKEDGELDDATLKDTLGEKVELVAFERLRRDSGLYLVEHLRREAGALAGVGSLTDSSYTVRSTVDPALQRATETALQDGLARYELSTGRMKFERAEANLGDAIAKLLSAPAADAAGKPAWQLALERARLPLYDVHWPAAIVLEKGRVKGGGEVVRVGLTDGRIVPLAVWNAAIRRQLAINDVVRVRLVETRGQGLRAELRLSPTVQGAAVMLENHSGRILAMTGGFSFPVSQLNRATQSHRQPGSTLKPLTYLAALTRGLQPNTLILDAPVTFAPVDGPREGTRPKDYWSPKNYDGGSSGLTTLRRGLENSRNQVTARLLDGAITDTPEQSLARVCELALEAQIYVECERYYPFVLGAQPLRLIDLAAFYAAIANEGARPSPYVIESVEEAGKTVYRREEKPPVSIGSADRVAFYQLKTMLQGVVERGTAASIRRFAPYVAGKTGTTEHENDAWFVGFTNDVTIAVWVGFDNADGQRRTLGRGQTGAKVALPIFAEIIQAAWDRGLPKVALGGPSPDIQRQIVDLPIDLRSGDRLQQAERTAFLEHFRLGRSGQLAETQYRLVPQAEAYASRYYPYSTGGDESAGIWGGNRDAYGYGGYNYGYGPYAQGSQPRYNSPSDSQQDLNGSSWWDDDGRSRYRVRRVDPQYFGRSWQYQ
jgi:membrane carboxypeptidase/penicillin-binding protein